ncbi:allene oxide cyclase barrel-like domain-containing protein [uncultured Cellulomonas sp.]|uniref:allene oxide cyclase barrel-like domain-containing protein n=1 Tax=uncultured Cellulomonas sp. TaxID=189682 RepID=UPI0028E21036|nr:hypothetical protein [uncultured Cellulomonas sp.]
MRKALVAAVVAVLGIVTLSAASPATDPVEKSHPRARVLAFDVQFTGFFLLDFSADGVREVTSITDPQLSPSRGDQIVFEDVLLRDGVQVGAGGGACTVTAVVPADPPIALSCQVSYQLADGQVVAQGRASNAPVKTLAVVGGTGRYVGASGELVLTELGNAENTGTLRITLERLPR